MESSPMLAAGILLAILLPGCLLPGVEVDPLAQAGRHLVDITIPIHVVAVGFTPGSLDFSRIEPLLPASRVPFHVKEAELFRIVEQPLHYSFTYHFHEASDEFAIALFAEAARLSRPAQPEPWLRAYDRESGQHRLCDPCDPVTAALERTLGGPLAPSSPVQIVDALALEDWIETQRGAHGLAFERGYTVFLFDHDAHEHLPRSTYHRYGVNDRVNNNWWSPDAFDLHDNMRAWGGRYDFVWLDLSAGPNHFDHRPWQTCGRGGCRDGDRVDAPVWDVRDDVDAFHGNLARNLHDFVTMKVARHPLYPFVFAEQYVLPVHVFVDPAAFSNPQSPVHGLRGMDVAGWFDPHAWRAAFEDLAPWIDFDVRVELRFLPDDAPEVAAILEESRLKGQPGYAELGGLRKHFADHADEYMPSEPGSVTIPTFFFVTDVGRNVPWSGEGGFADADEWGHSFGVFSFLPDAFLCTPDRGVLCFGDQAGGDSITQFVTAFVNHEYGHAIGLSHPHDTADLDEEGRIYFERNMLWSSTASALTYRHNFATFDRFDKDTFARGHAIDAVRRILEAAPGSPAAGKAREALALLTDLRERDAVAIAREALRLLDAELPEAWSRGEPGEEFAARLDKLASMASFCILSACGPDRTPIEGVAVARLAIEVPEDAANVRLELVDLAYDRAYLRRATVALYAPEGSFNGRLDGDFHHARVFGLPAGAGTYVVEAYFSSGAAHEYELRWSFP